MAHSVRRPIAVLTATLATSLTATLAATPAAGAAPPALAATPSMRALAATPGMRALAATPAVALAAVTARGIVDLGLLPGGRESRALAVNASGTVVGSANAPKSLWHPVYWRRGGPITRLRTQPADADGSAMGINVHGTMVGEVAGRPVRWSQIGGQPINLALLPGDTGGEAHAINDDGVSVGVSGSHAVRWDRHGRIAALRSLPGGITGIAYAINHRGAITGTIRVAGNEHGVRWAPDGSATDLGLLAATVSPATMSAATVSEATVSPATVSEATGIGRDGMVVGYLQRLPSYDVHAVRWGRQGHPAVLSTLGGPEAIATAINGTGLTVGSAQTTAPSRHRFVRHCVSWSRTGTITDLGSLVGADACTAMAVNDHGTIVGLSDGPGPQYHAVVWNW